MSDQSSICLASPDSSIQIVNAVVAKKRDVAGTSVKKISLESPSDGMIAKQVQSAVASRNLDPQ